MAKELEKVTCEELAGNLASVLDRVVDDNEAVVVEKEGKKFAILKPVGLTKTGRGKKARISPTRAEVARSKEGILKAAGGWKEIVDAEAFKAYVYKRRRSSSRPPVRL